MDGPQGQNFALEVQELRKQMREMQCKLSDVEEEYKTKNARLNESVLQLTAELKQFKQNCKEKDEALKQAYKGNKELCLAIKNLEKRIKDMNGDDTETKNSIVTDIIKLINKHRDTVLVGIGTGVICAFLTAMGVPFIFGAAVTWKSCALGGVAGGVASALVYDQYKQYNGKERSAN